MTKVLLVEDHDINREMLSERLEMRGYTVITAVNGQEAVLKSQTDMPDLILMDMNMPIMDGWTATRLIKSDLNTRSIPVIALTAHAMSGDREQCIEAGCDDYTPKPINFAILLQQMKALLSVRSS